MFESLAKVLIACPALYDISFVGDALSPSIIIFVFNSGKFAAGFNGAMTASSIISRPLGLEPMAWRPEAKYMTTYIPLMRALL